MDVLQSKLICGVYLTTDACMMQREKSERFDGVLHLLEVPYRELPMFECGVLEIACSYDKFNEWAKLIPHQQLSLEIACDDGREGCCRCLTSQISDGSVIASVFFWTELSRRGDPPKKTALSTPEN